MSGEVPLWEVFIRPRNGLAHKHVGSLHATDEVVRGQGRGGSAPPAKNSDIFQKKNSWYLTHGTLLFNLKG